MDFDLSDEQRLLKDNIDRLAQSVGRYGSSGSRAANTPSAANRSVWRRFGELGLLALPFAESDGGLGAGSIESMLVAEALGRHLSLQPYVASICLAGSILRFGGTAEQRRAYVPGISDGSVLIAFGFEEPQSRYDFSDVETTATRQGNGCWVLNGHKTAVIAGDAADMVIISARVAGRRFDRDGIALFCVPTNTPGLIRRAYVAHDETGGAELVLPGIELPAAAKLAARADGLAVIEDAADVALAASMAECVGIMDMMLRTTVDYLKTRKQFGKTIGEFQVLQHRAADMLMATEQARSMAILAASAAEEDDRDERRKVIAAARVQVGDSLHFVAGNALQLHGGIGLTEECSIGPYFKRATALEMFLGDTDAHFARFAATDGFIPLSIAG